MSAVNPFKPGAGRVPPVLAGRDAIMSVVDRVMRDVVGNGEGDRPIVISGLAESARRFSSTSSSCGRLDHDDGSP